MMTQQGVEWIIVTVNTIYAWVKYSICEKKVNIVHIQIYIVHIKNDVKHTITIRLRWHKGKALILVHGT